MAVGEKKCCFCGRSPFLKGLCSKAKGVSPPSSPSVLSPYCNVSHFSLSGCVTAANININCPRKKHRGISPPMSPEMILSIQKQ